MSTKTRASEQDHENADVKYTPVPSRSKTLILPAVRTQNTPTGSLNLTSAKTPSAIDDPTTQMTQSSSKQPLPPIKVGRIRSARHDCNIDEMVQPPSLLQSWHLQSITGRTTAKRLTLGHHALPVIGNGRANKS